MTKELGEKHPYLVCPVSKGDLYLVPDSSGLFCPESGITYPFHEGVPVMIPKADFLNPSERYYEEFKKKLNIRNFKNYFERRWSKLIRHTNLERIGVGQRILENGAGQGYATRLFRERTKADVYAIDYSMAACLKALGNIGTEASVCQADSCSLPFRDEYFDFVIGNALLHHIDNQKKAVEESTRVCKEGGFVVFIEPNRYHPLQILIALTHPRVEKGTLRMDPRKIRGYFLRNKRVKDVTIVPIFTILFAYQKFPPDILFPFFRAIEPIFDRPLLCTSYFIIARI